MTETTRRFFSGDTLEQAVMQAARHHGLEPDELAYRRIEKKHGFLKTRRRVVIEVAPEAPRLPAAARAAAQAAEAEAVAPAAGRDTEAPEPEPGREPGAPLRESDTAAARPAAEGPAREEAQPAAATLPAGRSAGKHGLLELPHGPRRARERFEPATGPKAEAAREALARIFALGELDLEAEILQGEERLEIELWGPDEEALLADRGRLLLGIQHLVPRLVRGLTGEAGPCRVDCENFHEIRAERLRDLAQRAASEVAKRGRPRTLEPMSPDERRIVHLTLADDPSVITESKGEGLFKRVMVRPAAQDPGEGPESSRRPRGFDPYRR